MEAPQEDLPTDYNTKETSGLLSFAKDIAGIYAGLMLLALIVWLIRWPFYGDDFYQFMQACFLYITIMFLIVAAWMIIFSIFCRFPILGITFIVLGIAASFYNKIDRNLDDYCTENRYTSDCD